MKTIKIFGVILAILVIVGLNTDVFAGYSELTPTEQAVVTQAWIILGSAGTVEDYYLIRRSEEIAIAKEEIRRSRINALFDKLLDATEEELTRIEGILNP